VSGFHDNIPKEKKGCPQALPLSTLINLCTIFWRATTNHQHRTITNSDDNALQGGPRERRTMPSSQKHTMPPTRQEAKQHKHLEVWLDRVMYIKPRMKTPYYPKTEILFSYPFHRNDVLFIVSVSAKKVSVFIFVLQIFVFISVVSQKSRKLFAPFSYLLITHPFKIHVVMLGLSCRC
jgi:hypothetical protein